MIIFDMLEFIWMEKLLIFLRKILSEFPEVLLNNVHSFAEICEDYPFVSVDNEFKCLHVCNILLVLLLFCILILTDFTKKNIHDL